MHDCNQGIPNPRLNFIIMRTFGPSEYFGARHAKLSLRFESRAVCLRPRVNFNHMVVESGTIQSGNRVQRFLCRGKRSAAAPILADGTELTIASFFHVLPQIL